MTDLKPDNVMLITKRGVAGGTFLKLLDFGLAKLVERPGTQSDVIMGTPAYMSPEQCRGAKSVTDRTDVYALGVMLFEMLTGKLPLSASDNGEQIAMHLFTPPPKMSEAAPSVPDPMSSLIDQLLLKDATRRPSMVDVMSQLALLSSRAPVLSPSIQKLVEPFADTAIGDAALARTLPKDEPLNPVSNHAAESVRPEHRSRRALWVGGSGIVIIAVLGVWSQSVGNHAQSQTQAHPELRISTSAVDASSSAAGIPLPVTPPNPTLLVPVDMAVSAVGREAKPQDKSPSFVPPEPVSPPNRVKKRRQQAATPQSPQGAQAKDKMEYEP